jgi:hypothetical protein
MDKAPMHTPGPWAVTKGKPRKVTANGVLICNAVLRNMATTAQNKNGKGEDEAEANARLIAAAPMLLEAAQDAVEGFKTLRIGLRDNKAAIECIDAHIDELNYAIAGATGIPT